MKDSGFKDIVLDRNPGDYFPTLEKCILEGKIENLSLQFCNLTLEKLKHIEEAARISEHEV